MKEIRLTKGKIAFVDDDDFKELSKTKWTYSHGYAQRTRFQKREYMHRIIMNPPSSLLVDHINGDGLNNTRLNLRIVTKSGNAHNLIAKSRNKSGFRGVDEDRRGTKVWFSASIILHGIRRRKWFKKKEDAIECRRKWESETRESIVSAGTK